jgi:hypothetical protein
MLSSTASSTSLAHDPIASRVESLAQPMLTLSSTASDCWTSDRPNTSVFSDHQIEALIYALIRWDQLPINRVLAGLTPPLDTETDRAAARRLLPFLVEAIIDALKEAEQRQGVQTDGDREVDELAPEETQDPREVESMLEIIAGAAVKRYGYRGPDVRSHAVSKSLSDVDQVGGELSDKTIRKFFKRAYELVARKTQSLGGKEL